MPSSMADDMNELAGNGFQDINIKLVCDIEQVYNA